jgi:hypothetical protein
VCLQGKLGDYSEAVASTFECPPQIWVGCAVGIYNSAIAQDDFEVEYVIASKTLRMMLAKKDTISCRTYVLGRVVGQPSSKYESPHTNVR